MNIRFTRISRGVLASVVLVLSVGLLAGRGSATTLYRFDLETATARAAAIVVATPERVETLPQDTASGRVVFTFTTLSVERVLKGDLVAGAPLVIKARGGAYAPESLVTVTSELPRLEVGVRYLLFLGADRNEPWNAYFLMGRSLGAYRLTSKPDGATEAVRLGTGAATLAVGRAVSDDRTTLAAVERLVTSTPAEPLPLEYRSAPPVPPGFRSGSGAPVPDVAPSYALWRPPSRWVEPDSGQAVVFYVNAATYTWPGDLNTAVNWAASQWSSVSGSRLLVANGGPTALCGFLTVNSVTTVAGDCHNELEGNGCYSGVIAEGGPRTFGPGSVVVGGTRYRIITSADIVLNDGGCDLGQSGVNGVVTHEMGHCLGLQHSTSPPCCGAETPTMYPAYFTGQDTLADDDRAGVRVIYPPPPGPPRIDQVTPNRIERGATTSITVTGTNLVAGGPPAVSVSGGGIGTVTIAPGASASSVTASVPVMAAAAESTRTLTVTTAIGSDAEALTVVGILAPSDLVARAVSATSIRLTWSDRSQVETSYKVQRLRNDGTWANVATLPANATTYTDSGLRPAKRYTYRVKAINATDSAASNRANATTPAA